MERNPQFQKVKKTQEALRYQFISTELDLALTFADIARSTNDEARSERNLDHAKKALRVCKTIASGSDPDAKHERRHQRKDEKAETLH